MLQLSRFEVRMNVIESKYVNMLYWVLKSAPELAGAFDLLLNLGGASLIDAVGSVFQQYTLLYSALARVVHEDYVSFVVAKGPNLHQVCFDDPYTESPYTESPISLAMYSSLAFGTWLYALVEAEVDFKSFIDQELEQNFEVHADWEKATLLDLFTHGDRPDLHVTNFSECSDCKMCSLCEPLVVQPYWRPLLERTKRGLYVRDPAQVSSELNGDKVTDHDSLGEAISSLTDLTPKPDTMGDVSLADLEAISSESESEEDTSEYSRTSDIGSNCLYSTKWCVRLAGSTMSGLAPADHQRTLLPATTHQSASTLHCLSIHRCRAFEKHTKRRVSAPVLSSWRL